MITADQLIRMSSPGKRYELVKGGLVVMEPTGGRHGQITMEIAFFLREHVKLRRLGTVFPPDTGFRLEKDPDTVLAPEVAFVAAGRLEPIPDAYPELAPDIAVEVISPSDSRSQVEKKARTWLELGARIVWIVDPKGRSITVHQTGREVRVLTEQDRLTADPVLPEFDCAVAEILRD